MNKYFNIIILSVLGFFYTKSDIKLTLVFPVLIFYYINNKKLIFISIPIIVLTLIGTNMILPMSIFLVICGLCFFVIKKKILLVNFLLVFIINFISLVVLNDKFDSYLLLINIGYSLISGLVYLLLEVIYTKNLGFSLIELFIAALSIVASKAISISGLNISFIITIYFVIYFSKEKNYKELIFIIGLYYILFKHEIDIDMQMILILTTGFVYSLGKVIDVLVLLIISIVFVFINKERNDILLISEVVGVGLFVEIFKSILICNKDNLKLETKLYQTQIEKVNNDILSYASFLDNFSKKYVESKEYQISLSKAITDLNNNYCNSCYKKNECFKKNKGKMYTIYKDLLIYGAKDDLCEAKVLEGYCPTLIEMRKSAYLINQKLNIKESLNKKTSLIAEINGVSSILRQFTINNSLKKEIDYNLILKLKEELLKKGLSLEYFNPKELFVDEFIIELGFRNTSFKEVNTVCEEISSNILNIPTSAIYKEAKINKTYINLVPKIIIEVSYGYAIHAEEENLICGDNFLIKQLNDYRFVCLICDGMGKGVYANNKSNEMITMVNDILSLPVSTSVGLQMINTFCYLEDYLDKFSTLDFLEINRCTSEAKFYKLGSASSYIYRENNKLVKIENKSLPFGLEEMIDEQTFTVEKGDLIIMSSDGIIDNLINEDDFKKYIMNLKHLSTQKIAYEIMSYVSKNDVKCSDDRCVIVLKIESS